ncbi:MAG: hypothetical protein OEV28_00780 [Nitrospirota bacterium]|nr:hypothetical protein [Nitrospirota bacterium]
MKRLTTAELNQLRDNLKKSDREHNGERVETENRIFWQSKLVYWASKAPRTRVSVEIVDHFDARGMKCIYGRGDHFQRSYHMDIWKTSKGRVLMRFWSRNIDVEWCSYEVKGLDLRKIPDLPGPGSYADWWIPKSVRAEYDAWILYDFSSDEIPDWLNGDREKCTTIEMFRVRKSSMDTADV